MFESLFIPMNDERIDRDSPLFNIFRNRDWVLGNDVVATQDNALTFDTVYACINVLSDDIAKLPFKTYQKDKKTGAIQEITDNDVFEMIRIRPNESMTPFSFIKLVMTDVLLHGNAYVVIERDKNGKITQLIPLTSATTWATTHKGKLFYVTNIDGEYLKYHSDSVIHIKGLTTDGLTGLSPIQAIRYQLESNGLAQRYNRDMISKDGVPQGLLTVDTSLSPEVKQKVKEEWRKVNAGETIAIADNGIQYKQLGLSQEDMQWLESQKFNTQRIASIFKVPLHKINDLEHATYSNIENQSLDYIKNTLQPWVTQLEEEFGYKLYTKTEASEGFYVKFNMDSELRGDSEARAKVNEINLRNGFKTINEIRASNEDSPFLMEFADKPYMTLNYAPAENVADFNDNHFGKKLNEDPGSKEVEKGEEEANE